MANGYPDNQACWDCANNHIHPVDGAITVFAYAALTKHTPCQETSIDNFNAYLKDAYAAASGTGIDPVYIFGFEQAYAQKPNLSTPAMSAIFDGYLNQIGVRDPNTGKLVNVSPGPGMYRPGPGDGYVGNGAPTDPNIGHNPLAAAVGQAVAAIAGPAAGTQAGVAAQQAVNNPGGFLTQHPLGVAIGAGALLLLLMRRR